MLTGIAAAFFYLFAFIMIASALMVITARNPVHSVLFLILAFFNAAALFLLTGAEFLAMILVVVYVGAVAVLFLFVVMMLDVDFAELKQGALKHAPIGALVGVVLLAELILYSRPRSSRLKLQKMPLIRSLMQPHVIIRRPLVTFFIRILFSTSRLPV